MTGIFTSKGNCQTGCCKGKEKEGLHFKRVIDDSFKRVEGKGGVETMNSD